MRIEQLEYVAAVTRYGSLRRASEHLHVSQPALSEALTKLERELGVPLLDRRRSGTRVNDQGRELLQHMLDVLDAVDQLKAAAVGQRTSGRAIRLGTVNAATTPVLLPAVRAFQQRHPTTAVEIRNVQSEEISVGLADGGLDVGLVNLLEGDDPPPDIIATPLLEGRPVVVMPEGHPLTAPHAVEIADLRREPFIAMRAGYLMHRFAHRIFGGDLPTSWHTADGAEMGKLMVAEGLGLTVLPDYSVVGDPLERLGVITTRPVAGDRTRIGLVAEQPRRGQPPAGVRDLMAELIEQASRVGARRAQSSG